MLSPAAMEEGDEVLQVVEICEAAEEMREVVISTIEGETRRNSGPVARCGPGSKTSQVRLTSWLGKHDY